MNGKSYTPGSTPGGPVVSSAKKRRLAAIDEANSKSYGKHISSTAAGEAQGTESVSTTKSNKKQQSRTSGSWNAKLLPGKVTSSTAWSQRGFIPTTTAADAGPPYDTIGSAIHDGPLTAILQLSERPAGTSIVDSLLESLIKSGPRAFEARGSAALRLQDKTLLLDNPAASVPRAQGQSPSIRQQLVTGAAKAPLYAIRASSLRFEGFRSLHALWKQYIESMRSGTRSMEEQLISVDLHGCYLRIVSCKEPRHKGLCGIVIKDSGLLFHIITQDNRVHSINKPGSTFETGVGVDTIVQFNGDKLCELWNK